MASVPAEARLKDPYEFDAADVSAPPTGLLPSLKRIGPGMILAASIVGSGELIATTTLGAEVGYVALWVILLSCFIKPAVQAELGRYTIATGKTGLGGFNEVPGPKWRVSWVVWLWLCMIAMTRFQIGAMFGGVAQVMTLIFPAVPINAWVVVLLAITLALLLGGGYERIERLATLKVALFSMLTLLCALLLMQRPEYFSWGQLREGLKFRLPSEGGLATAVAVFGITGVGASELFMYPYWCVEKGYARFTGARDGTAAWRSRAVGWMSVMHVDILASMFIYTIATVAFFLLGAGILHGQGVVPSANDMIPVLSRMYTETLGGWALWLFYIGAIATLYGTIFAATAAESRVSPTCAACSANLKGRLRKPLKYRNLAVWLLTVVPAALFMFVQSRWRWSGRWRCQAMMLPVIAGSALYLRHKRLPREVHPNRWATAGLWFASIVIMSVMGYYAVLMVI